MKDFWAESLTWELAFDLNSDITLYVRHRGAAFRICYCPRILATSPSALKQHHYFYRILYKDDPDDGKSCAISERLRKPFEELMAQIAANIPTESTGYLHAHLYPSSFILEAGVAENGRVRPYFKETISRQKFEPPGEWVGGYYLRQYLSPLLDSNLDKYSSRQVQVLAQSLRLVESRIPVPSKVLVDGTVYFFKQWRRQGMYGYYELQAYMKILADADASTPLLSDARICRLHGLVVDDIDDALQHYPLDPGEQVNSGRRLVGLLLTYIESRGTLDDLAPWSDCTNEERLRWSRQMHHSIDCLHEAGVAWGDAKPENVLIDLEGDAWLVDFGGSYTPGRVDEDKRETMEGDRQGVQRIDDWLAKWSRETLMGVVKSVGKREWYGYGRRCHGDGAMISGNSDI